MEILKKCAFIQKSDIEKTLESKPTEGKKLLEPLKTFALSNKVPFNILENKDIENEAEIHHHEGDLWHCLEGETAFICGGEMVNPWFKDLGDGKVDEREVKAKEIKGGVEKVLKPGDWLWIPAGVPHQHKATGVSRLIIIKVPKV